MEKTNLKEEIEGEVENERGKAWQNRKRIVENEVGSVGGLLKLVDEIVIKLISIQDQCVY